MIAFTQKDELGRITKPARGMTYGHSVCNSCGKDMPVCWDTVCLSCHHTFCYDCSVTVGNRWYCKECKERAPNSWGRLTALRDFLFRIFT